VQQNQEQQGVRIANFTRSLKRARFACELAPIARQQARDHTPFV
jgi:hypothetical protein